MTLPDKLSPGMVLGRYELLLPIAQGGMATVWAARQKGSRGFQKTVAIKTMLPALSDDPQFEQMFLDEAALASRIHHPNVAEILDVGEQDDVIYIVMEWVDGEALSVLTKTAKKNNITFSQRIALRIVRQACGGLHSAHELRDETPEQQLIELVHRDVSPQNILVSYDGIVKMVDFGVAKALGRAAGETTAGQLKGKVPYMSPEQALGKKIDRRTDIFAMGIVLYRLTTGLHPFLGESDIVTMKNIISRPVLPPRMKNPSFPAELERVLLTCLKKDANERYQTMLELDAAIERVLAIAGASVVDDDIGGFVRSVMGDRGQKRRGALRDAVRSADERAAGIATTPNASSMPQMIEGVTDIALTRMNTALTSVPTNLNSMAPASIIPPMPEGYEGTGVAHGMPGSMLPTDPYAIPRERGRTGVIVAIGAIGALAIGGTFFALRSSATPTPTPPVHTTQTESTPRATQAAPTTPPAPAPTPAPVEAASAAPVADPAASAATININDLPTGDTKTDAKTDTKTDTKKTANTTKSSTGGAATTTAPTTTSTTKKNWVPGVQDPGF